MGILCGRGNVFSNHEGNQYFGRIIRSNLREYREAANRPEKIRVVDKILKEIRLSGVRFAKIDHETKQWYELNDVQAHQKIGHAIRDTIRLLKDKSNKAAKTSKPSMRIRQPRAFILPEQMQSSLDARQKAMEKILQERTSSMGPLFLKDEYPEESFDFSARSFFGDYRMTSQ